MSYNNIVNLSPQSKHYFIKRKQKFSLIQNKRSGDLRAVCAQHAHQLRDYGTGRDGTGRDDFVFNKNLNIRARLDFLTGVGYFETMDKPTTIRDEDGDELEAERIPAQAPRSWGWRSHGLLAKLIAPAGRS